MKHLIFILANCILVVFFQWINVLPWWGYVIPVFIVGIVMGIQQSQLRTFIIGFVAGFLSWIIPSLYFDFSVDGESLLKIASIINISYFPLMLIIGTIGGVTTGLALYSGFLLGRGRKELKFDYESRK